MPGTQKGWTFGKRCRAKLEGISEIRNQSLKEQLHLRKERTSSRMFRKTIELEATDQIFGTSIILHKMRD
jgi:hypothetical protein